MAIIFACLLAWASYDIGSRTTFPGSKPQLKERLKKQLHKGDTVKHPIRVDSSSKSAT
jgi:hypothetical protein